MTLFELLLVLSLLVVLGSFAATHLEGTLLRSRLQQSAEQLRTEWAKARLQAIETGTPVLFTCCLGTGEFQLVATGAAIPAATAEVAEVAAAEPAKSSGKLEEGVVFRQAASTTFDGLSTLVEQRDPKEGEWTCPILFQPDGNSFSADILLELESAGGKQIRITLQGVPCLSDLLESESAAGGTQ